jgi:hypothetical protein
MLRLIELLMATPYKAVVRYEKDIVAKGFTSPDENGQGGNFIRRGYAMDLVSYIQEGRIPDGEVIAITVADGWDGGLPQPCYVIKDK